MHGQAERVCLFWLETISTHPILDLTSPDLWTSCARRARTWREMVFVEKRRRECECCVGGLGDVQTGKSELVDLVSGGYADEEKYA